LAIHNSISNVTHCPTIDRFIINEINQLLTKSNVSAFNNVLPIIPSPNPIPVF